MDQRDRGRSALRPLTRKRFDHGEPISRIDTRPMAFVFAIIGLFAMLWNLNQERTHTLLVDLPNGWLPPDEQFAPPPYIMVRVTEAGQAFMDDELVPISGLSKAIAAKQMDYPLVVFHADADADYGTSALALNAIVKAGIGQNEICFLGLEEHRMFQSAAFVPAHTIIPSDEGTADWKSARDIAPSRCSLFFKYQRFS